MEVTNNTHRMGVFVLNWTIRGMYGQHFKHGWTQLPKDAWRDGSCKKYTVTGLFIYICIYIYIHVYVCTRNYTYVYIIYIIYIYVYTHKVANFLTLCDCCTIRAWSLPAMHHLSMVVWLHCVQVDHFGGI